MRWRGRERERYSDPDASWGHRSSISTRCGGGYYGYKLHAAVCTTTGPPVAWQVATANVSETAVVMSLRARGFAPDAAVLDRGYDRTTIYDGCEDPRHPPRHPPSRLTSVKVGKHLPPSCEHGE